MSDGRFWMWFWIAVLVLVTVQTVIIGVMGQLGSVVAVSIMSIEALYFGVGAGFQATLSMRKADPKDPM